MLTISELQTELQKLTQAKIKQSDFAKALGTTKSNISLRMKNKSEATPTEIKKIVSFLNIQGAHDVINNLLRQQNRLITEYISEDSMPVEDTILIDYYPDVFGSCGNGSFVFSENKEQIEIPKYCIRSYSGFKQYSVINARGDSMSPYILDNDKLVVEHCKNGQQIDDNRIYVFRFYDNIFVKRLVLNLDQIVVKSDNKEYSTRNIERFDADNFELIGRIVGIWREEK